MLSDKTAEKDADLSVIDESGEVDLFSADRFAAIEIPAAVKASLLKSFRIANPRTFLIESVRL